MPDVLGWRCKFGVVTPSTNTVVQPEYDDMRPAGVTNHVARMHIPNDPVRSDDDFAELIRRIDASLEGAVERVMTAGSSASPRKASGAAGWKRRGRSGRARTA
jgi:maleate isomerase